MLVFHNNIENFNFYLDGVCYNVHWETNVLKSLQDCFDLSTSHQWYVGPEEYEQHFPLKIENERKSVPFLPGDMLQVWKNFIQIQIIY